MSTGPVSTVKPADSGEWDEVWLHAPSSQLSKTQLAEWNSSFLAHVQEDDRTLECGCGDGLISIFLSKYRQANANAIDFSREAARVVRRNEVVNLTRLGFALADVTAIPFKDGTFDLTFSLGVNEHLSQGDRLGSLAEMIRVTKSRGTIVIDVPNRNSVFYFIGMEIRKKLGHWAVGFELPYKKSELMRLSAQAGNLVSVRFRHYGFVQSLLFLLPSRLWPYLPAKQLDNVFDRSPLRYIGRGLVLSAKKAVDASQGHEDSTCQR